ncbi:MAG: Sir2 family NAD-dependent protein deacetylase, partial [Chloroflexota bacterium]
VEETSIPDCPYCGELARYDVIMFGEYLHAYPMEQANIIIEQTDLMIVIGTSGVVAPASKIPLRAQDNGAKLIEINPTISRITPNVDVFIPLNSEQALPRILEAIKKTI